MPPFMMLLPYQPICLPSAEPSLLPAINPSTSSYTGNHSQKTADAIKTVRNDSTVSLSRASDDTRHQSRNRKLVRTSSLSTISEKDPEDVTPAPSLTSSASQLVPSATLITPPDSPEASTLVARAKAWEWWTWSGQNTDKSQVPRLTIEDLPDVGTAAASRGLAACKTAQKDTCPKITFAPGLPPDSDSDSDTDSTVSSRWSDIISRDVYLSRTYIVGTHSPMHWVSTFGSGYGRKEERATPGASLDCGRKSAQLERVEEWRKTALCHHRYRKDSLIRPAPPSTLGNTITATSEFTRMKKNHSTVALRQVLAKTDLEALCGSYQGRHE